jgi:hypothetical protein
MNEKQPSKVALTDQPFYLSFLSTLKIYQHTSKHSGYEERTNVEMTELLKTTIALDKLHFMHLSCGYS